MKRRLLLIAVLFLLATISPVQADPQTYEIQRTERAADLAVVGCSSIL